MSVEVGGHRGKALLTPLVAKPPVPVSATWSQCPWRRCPVLPEWRSWRWQSCCCFLLRNRVSQLDHAHARARTNNAPDILTDSYQILPQGELSYLDSREEMMVGLPRFLPGVGQRLWYRRHGK